MTSLETLMADAAVIVRPGEHLVISFAHMSGAQMEMAREELADRWPDLSGRILFVVGECQMAVIKDALAVPPAGSSAKPEASPG